MSWIRDLLLESHLGQQRLIVTMLDRKLKHQAFQRLLLEVVQRHLVLAWPVMRETAVKQLW